MGRFTTQVLTSQQNRLVCLCSALDEERATHWAKRSFPDAEYHCSVVFPESPAKVFKDYRVRPDWFKPGRKIVKGLRYLHQDVTAKHISLLAALPEPNSASKRVSCGLPHAERRLVYLLAAPCLNQVKIGHSTNPASRIENLRTGCPVPTELIAILPESESEYMWHKSFDAQRLKGEWFTICRGMCKKLQKLGLISASVRLNEILKGDPEARKVPNQTPPGWRKTQRSYMEGLECQVRDARAAREAANHFSNIDPPVGSLEWLLS